MLEESTANLQHQVFMNQQQQLRDQLQQELEQDVLNNYMKEVEKMKRQLDQFLKLQVSVCDALPLSVPVERGRRHVLLRRLCQGVEGAGPAFCVYLFFVQFCFCLFV